MNVSCLPQVYFNSVFVPVLTGVWGQSEICGESGRADCRSESRQMLMMVGSSVEKKVQVSLSQLVQLRRRFQKNIFLKFLNGLIRQEMQS